MQDMNSLQLAVVGAGISGITSAIRLLEAGFKVRLLTREPILKTTSSVAAAMWHPGGADQDPMRGWCLRSFEVFKQLARDEHSGVKLVRAFELSNHPFEDKGLELADDLTRLSSDQFASPWRYGYHYTTARITVPKYLPFLFERFEALGGVLEHGEVDDLARLPEKIIVNASGLGAKTLVDDRAVYPIRGQIIRIARPSGFPDDIIHIHAGETYTYIIPRDEDCILGGTYQVHDENLEADANTAQAILERTSAIRPEIKEAIILEHKVGLRPGRAAVRLEREKSQGKLIIHNYGHGSVGHTLAWGCAEDVLKRVSSDFPLRYPRA